MGRGGEERAKGKVGLADARGTWQLICLKAHLGMGSINPVSNSSRAHTFYLQPSRVVLQVRKKVAREASDVNKLGVKLPKSALYNKVGDRRGEREREGEEEVGGAQSPWRA